MSDEMGIEKIDLDKVDWRGSRDFFESLGEALDKLDDKDESYDFTWVGKRKSIIEAGAPINKTLRPDVANSKNWDTTENLFIEGDNLDALKLLQESYLGKVKMIYIDPPYNTGKDFVYHDNFRADTEQYDEDTEYKDNEGNIQFKKNEKSNGRYHSDWLSMMYPRLKLARNLLSEDGVIFISIDDNEQANLKKLCDEVLGEDNFIAQFIHKNNSSKNQAKLVSISTEYFLCYARDRFSLASSEWRVAKKGAEDIAALFTKLRLNGLSNDEILAEIKDMYSRPKYSHLSRWNKVDDKGVFKDADLSREGGPKDYTIINPETGNPCTVPSRGWGKSYEELLRLQKEDLIYYGSDNTPPGMKDYISTDDKSVPDNFWYFDNSIDTRWVKSTFDGILVFENPKPVAMMQQIIELHTSNNDLILDFFSGSGSTAHAVMQLNAEDGGNRKWIMVQLPEETDEKSEAFKAGYRTIPEISRERIRRAGDKIAVEHPEAKVDYGFRALRIDDTNYKEVYKPAGEQQQSTLLNLVDNIKDDRSELDLLYGVITQSALELNRPLETKEIAGSEVFLYDYFGEVSGLVACFGDSISEETIKEIARLKPLTAVFRDSTFPDSQAKVNLGEHFRILSAETKVKVI